MIEIPEIWSECEITQMSKRTRDLIEAVMTEAGFIVELIDDNGVKITPQQGSKLGSFNRVIDTVSCAARLGDIKFSVPNTTNKPE